VAVATETTGRRRAHVVLPQELVDRIDARVGPRGRSRYIQDAIEDRLKREERVEAFEALMRSHSGETIPEWDTAESTDEWVRQIRAEWDQRPASDPS